jgi:hypothetical protein
MWTYYQKNGRLLNAQRRLVGMGYSGHDEGKNNPAMQNLSRVGPIPCGTYTIGAPFDSESHGPYCLPLTPDTDNEMFGRSGFLMHGDSIVHPGMASLGCIIQLHAVRETVWKSGDHRLKVVCG